MLNNQRHVTGKATGGAWPRMLGVAVAMRGQTYGPALPPTSAEHLLGEMHRAEPHEALPEDARLVWEQTPSTTKPRGEREVSQCREQWGLC